MYCRDCGYRLNELSKTCCPECGRVFDPADLQSYRLRPYLFSPFQKKLMVCMVICTPILFYGWVYLITVQGAMPAAPIIAKGQTSIPLIESYDFGGKASENLFAPVHWLDRRIRPQRWERKLPVITTVAARLEDWTDSKATVFRYKVTNVSSAPIYIKGYALDQIFYYADNGSYSCYCGTGAHDRLLAPGASTTLDGWLKHKTITQKRVALPFSWVSGGPKIRVWTPVIKKSNYGKPLKTPLK